MKNLVLLMFLLFFAGCAAPIGKIENHWEKIAGTNWFSMSNKWMKSLTSNEKTDNLFEY